MANPEHLEILKQGVEVWNRWRSKNKEWEAPEISDINLTGANLTGANLAGVNLEYVNLQGANLQDANLEHANLTGVNLEYTNLKDASFKHAYAFKHNYLKAAEAQRHRTIRSTSAVVLHILPKHLSAANTYASLRLSGRISINVSFNGANIKGVNLEGAKFQNAGFHDANLEGANLQGAHIIRSFFENSNLENANLKEASLKGSYLGFATVNSATTVNTLLSDAEFEGTKLINVDLSTVKGLEQVYHRSPSMLDTNTLQLSQGKIPEEFLRGCGLSDWEIESAKLYNPELSNQAIGEILYRVHDLRASQALQISPLFISYSHADSKFVDTMEKKLNDKGVRFWRDIHDMKAGRIEKQIDTAIRHNPTVLVILSENSTKSDWVEHEVRTARLLEKELTRDVLCPVALDDSWKTARWPARIMEQIMEYNILDFSGWQDADKFNKQFGKLIDGLDIFY